MWPVLFVEYRLLFTIWQTIRKSWNNWPIYLQLSCLLISSAHTYGWFKICLSSQNLCINRFNHLWKKRPETAVRFYKCIIQRRIQLSWSHTRQGYCKISAKEAWNVTVLDLHACWQHQQALLPIVRSSLSQISERKNKLSLNYRVTVTGDLCQSYLLEKCYILYHKLFIWYYHVKQGLGWYGC